jgi:hypothetical protein
VAASWLPEKLDGTSNLTSVEALDLAAPHTILSNRNLFPTIAFFCVTPAVCGPTLFAIIYYFNLIWLSESIAFLKKLSICLFCLLSTDLYSSLALLKLGLSCLAGCLENQNSRNSQKSERFFCEQSHSHELFF